MSDYQAIYDAVRSRISGGNIGSTVESVLRECFDISYQTEYIKQELLTVTYEMQRPFYLLKPPVYLDGNQWCCLYGENIHIGVVGFGNTPDEATRAFDKEWIKEAQSE